MSFNRRTLLVAARAKIRRAAAAAQLARLASEVDVLRTEAAADRRALAEARDELRTRRMMEADIAAPEEGNYIVAIVDSLRRATNFADALAIAVGLVRIARAMGASTPEARTYLSLEMIRTAASLDADVMGARWQ
jgi:hypothetical protein